MELIISVKPGVDFPRSAADVVRNAILEADKDKVAEWLEYYSDKNVSDGLFLSVFTSDNRKLLAQLLRGKIKKKRGNKQERGFDDFLILTHYKNLLAQGLKPEQAKRKTAEDLLLAKNLPEGDLFRQAAEGRFWKEENIEENVKEIISKLNKFLSIEIAPPKSP